MTATILIVDDIEQNVKLLEAKLLNEYYIVFKAYSAMAAFTILENNKIDIILLDVMMPIMDGFEACKKIKANPLTTHIPVVMVTALSETENRVKGLESGADEFLTKPVDDVALIARIKSLSRMKAVIDELKLRNNTNLELGGEIIKMDDNFSDTKILIIDDDFVQAKNVMNILKKIVDEIKIITDIEQLDNNIDYKYDLVIVSCQLDNNDPLRISVNLRASNNFSDAVIMLLAEEENISMVMKGLELAVNDYFIYPIESSELIARTKAQLRRKKYQDNLRSNLQNTINLSIKDGLTGIFNRRYFDVHIKQLVQKSNEEKKIIGLMMCDIDKFKNINDTHGHQAGDVVLKTLANILNKMFRVTDLVSRYGGEEFTILLENITAEEIISIAERLRDKIAKTDFLIDDNKTIINNTISIGVTIYKYGESISEFIERSDKNLYEAKETGRNKVIYK
jgi:two-component system cell cycle response regulator